MEVVMQSEEPMAEGDSAMGAYDLADAGVGGDGLRPELAQASWAELRTLAYGDRI
jgi:hypothetical protein